MIDLPLSPLTGSRRACSRIGTVESAEVVARRGGEAQLVADEEIEHGPGVATDRAVRFVGDDEIEVGRREELLKLVVEEQGLHGGYDNLRASPVVPVLLVDHRLKVGGEHRCEGLLGLVLQLKAIHKEQNAPHVAGTEKQ